MYGNDSQVMLDRKTLLCTLTFIIKTTIYSTRLYSQPKIRTQSPIWWKNRVKAKIDVSTDLNFVLLNFWLEEDKDRVGLRGIVRDEIKNILSI